MRKIFVLAACFALSLSLVSAEPAVFTGKPAIENTRIELFAKTMQIAQAKATAATMALKEGSNISPESASGTEQAIKSLAGVLLLGNSIVNAEELACRETGMDPADFHEVKIRFVQARMLQNMDALKSGLIGKQSGAELTEEITAKIDKKLADLETRLQKSRESLEKARSDEAGYFTKQDKKIADQKKNIEKLQQAIGKESNSKKQIQKQKQLTSAQERLPKLEKERQQPYKALVTAAERVEKDEKAVAQFKEAMPEAKKQMALQGAEIQQYQDKMSEGFSQAQNSDLMKQAAIDLPIFQKYPDLQPFLVEPDK
ncbi:MAG: hypothetical protein KKB51_11015 [Candidatus Riflebacteria bacterium]|nr:hypothetical protein [Candidatus Riflebacteria bacterium]